FPPPGEKAAPELVDWSGDGTKALFYTQSSEPSQAIIVDLHTGKQTPITVDGYPRFSRPDGKALLQSQSAMSDRPATLERVDLDGRPQLTYPTDKLESPFNGRYLSTPDGTRLILGTETAGLATMANDGTVGSALPVPGQGQCSPVRWWDTAGTTVLANCTS